MIMKHTLEKQSFEVRFSFDHPPRGLYLKSGLATSHYARVQVFDPMKILIGEIFHGFGKDFEALLTGEEEASLNGKKASLRQGEYQVRIEIYGQELPVDWELVVEENPSPEVMPRHTLMEEAWFEPERGREAAMAPGRYLKGDFHGHTQLSDGDLSHPEALEVMASRGLDFMALTEHNRVGFGQKKTPVRLIPSFELTLPKGHLNIHGVKDPLLFTDTGLTDEAMKRVVDRYKGEANISLNHPFLEPWAYHDDTLTIKDLDTMEIICDPTYSDSLKANREALGFLKFLWNKGFTLYGIGGSDAHLRPENFNPMAVEPSIYGDPATYVFSRSLSVEGILEGVKKGDVVVSRYFQPIPLIGGGKIRPGDSITEKMPFDYLVEVRNLPAGKEYRINLLFNNEIVKTGPLQNGGNRLLENAHRVFEGSTASFKWMAVEILGHDDEVISWINPIYQGEVNPSNPLVHHLVGAYRHG